LVVGHMYAIMEPEGNEEGIEYWLAQCVEIKHKLTHTRVYDDGFEYPTGSVMVVGTWIRTYIIR